MLATLGIGITLIGASLGFTGHNLPKEGCCDVCGVESAAVTVLIDRLQHSPRWRQRDNAAHALRKFSWKCHPEVPIVLANALLHDCKGEVREEAAESLTKLAPCMPEVHEALQRAALCDPHHATRKWAAKGLKAIGNHCIGECVVCVPSGSTTIYEAPVPTPAPNAWPSSPGDSQGPIIVPPTELEPIDAPLGRSPFVSPTASRDPKQSLKPAPSRRRTFLIGRSR